MTGENTVVQLRREVTEELAQAWHNRMLDRLAGYVRVKPWGDLHEASRAGYRTKVGWLVAPVMRLMRRHPVVIMVGGPDVTEGVHQPFADWCKAGCGRFECSRAVGHTTDFHAAGNGDHVVAVWTAGLR